MTGILASINSLQEAELIQPLNIDIIDLKQPAHGALGALNRETVKQIVDFIDGNNIVSATIGDLPMQPDIIFDAVLDMASTGVDFIKIGFFPGHDWQGTLEKLSLLAPDHALIAVLLADTRPDFAIIAQLQKAGFKGVMLDTMDKERGSLLELMPIHNIREFVDIARDNSLLSGLAGSLKESDIPELLGLDADYLGFRGALCERHKRTRNLDKTLTMRLIQHFIPSECYRNQPSHTAPLN